jgi:Autoinducer binding domain
MVNQVDFTAEHKAPFRSYRDATHYLEDLAKRTGIKHFSYWLVSNQDGSPDDVIWISTYDPNYMSFYMSQYTPMGDPGFGVAIGKGSPLDWTHWQQDDPVTKTLLENAARYGIGKYGISLPFRDPYQNDILFSVNVESNDAEWETLRLHLVATYWPFLEQFHARVWPLVIRKPDEKLNFEATFKGRGQA